MTVGLNCLIAKRRNAKVRVGLAVGGYTSGGLSCAFVIELLVLVTAALDVDISDAGISDEPTRVCTGPRADVTGESRR